MENENGVSCRGYAVGHIASPYGDMLEFELFGEEQTWCLVMVPDFGGGRSQADPETETACRIGRASLVDRDGFAEIPLGGRIRDIGNTRHGAFLRRDGDTSGRSGVRGCVLSV